MNEIVGSKGKLSFSTFGNEPVLLTAEDGTTEFEFEPPQHVHQPLVELIVAELTGAHEKCSSTGISGARTNKVMTDFFT